MVPHVTDEEQMIDTDEKCKGNESNNVTKNITR